MENHFAGAKDHSDRRRRWLSQEDRPETPLPAEPSEPALSSGPTNDPRVTVSSTRRVVSKRLWMVAISVCCLTLISAAVIWLQDSRRLHFGEGPMTQLPDDLTARFSGLLLLGGGLYALFIGWIRSESEVDFKGRYRCWRWLALYLGLIGSFQILAIGHLLPELFSRMLAPVTGAIHAARPAVVLSVSLTASVLVLSRVLPDMGRCGWSQATLTGAVLMMVVRFMLQHSAHNVIQQGTLDALFLMSANTTLAALLLHCWYVAWVNNAPPSDARRVQDRRSAKSIVTPATVAHSTDSPGNRPNTDEVTNASEDVLPPEDGQSGTPPDASPDSAAEPDRKTKKRKSRRKRRAA